MKRRLPKTVDAKRWIARRSILSPMTRWSLAFWLILTVVSVGVVFVAALVAGREATQSPPFTYSRETYSAVDTTLCPGELLVYVSELTINRVPTVVQIIRTLWRVTPPGTIVRTLDPEYANWFDIVTVTTPIRYEVPAVGAGDYELRVSSEDASSGAIEWYRVPFKVIDCP